MPTRNRRGFIARAIQYFQRQTYRHRELIIVDDGEDCVVDLVPDDERIRYVSQTEVETVGLKRNRACALARGTLIAHWDDDDWYSPLRLELQVSALLKTRARLVGVSSLLYYDATSGRAFEYSQPREARPWLSMLLYEKALWRAHPHPSDRVGSDTAFLRRLPVEACSVMAERDLCVCFAHGQNLAPKRFVPPRWRAVPTEMVASVLGDDWPFAPGAPVRALAKPNHAAVTWRVVVFSCDRPRQLALLLEDLARERAAGASIQVHVYDDASDDPLSAAESVIQAQGWRITRAPTRHGKRGFAAWVSRAYAELRSAPAAAMLAFLPDDSRLCCGFFERAWSLWQSIDDPNRRTLTVLVDALRERAPCWTEVAPTRKGLVWQTQWVDGAFIADHAYLAALQYSVPPISPRWWQRGPRVSSGVGRAISLRLHGAGHNMYCVHDSLIEHVEGPSIMHPWMPHDRLSTVRYVDSAQAPVRELSANSAAHRSAPARWIVTIMTCERPGLLSDLLRDLEREAEQHPNLQVHVYDDASTADYSEPLARITARGWRYVRAAQRHGKRGFQSWVSESWAALRGYGGDTLFAFLPDDCRLCDDFFVQAGQLYQELPSERRGTLNVLVDGSRRAQPCWTGVLPRRVGAVDLTQWVDGAFVADSGFLEALNYRVPPVSESRWERDSSRSSGVGEAISLALHAQGFQMYRVAQSLIVHVEAESQMNAAARAREPLVAVEFIDGEGAHRRLRERVPVVASLASILQRQSQLQRTVQSLLPQVDRLQVFLNGYESVPSFLEDARIEVARSQDHGDRGDAAKFFWCEQHEGYQFTCDDDIVYPRDFVHALVSKIEQYDRRAVVGLHGVVLNQPCRSYYRDRRVLHFRRALHRDHVVHILGTGACAWHTSALTLRLADFRLANMADIWLGVACQRQRVPMVAVERREGWLQGQAVAHSIYERSRRHDAPHTHAVAEVETWQLFTAEAPLAAAPPPEVATVSVLVPVASDRGFLREALASVAAQAGVRVLDLIVINDGCGAIDQRSVTALWSGSATLRYIEQSQRSGQSAALNRALQLCQGDFVTVLHDDDVMLSGKLQRLCERLLQHPEHAVAYSLAQHIGAGGQSLATPLQYETFLATHPCLSWADVLRERGLMVHGGTTMYRRSALLQVGGWDENLDTAEEWELHLRLLRQGHSFVAAPYVTTGYRIHERNKSAQFRGRRRAQMAYIRRKHSLPDAHGNELPSATDSAGAKLVL